MLYLQWFLWVSPFRIHLIILFYIFGTREVKPLGPDFIFLGSKITADCDYSHEIKRYLLFGRKAMRKLDSILKSRDIANKSPYSQSYGFSSGHVWMSELDHKEGWPPENWCFWAVVFDKTLESPWIVKRSNQSILKEISPEYWLEGLMLKLQYFDHLM